MVEKALRADLAGWKRKYDTAVADFGRQRDEMTKEVDQVKRQAIDDQREKTTECEVLSELV